MAGTEKYCVNCACLLLRHDEEAGGTRPARVEELLHHNHPPLDVELPAFLKLVEDTRATLNDLDSKIIQAQELLENLLSARQHAQSRLEDTKSLLHPMRSIPNELLVEIFRHCISETHNDEDPDSLDPNGAPWLLTRVCHRWRELAVNTPQLWTHLLLDFDKHLGHITERQCAYKTGLFIQRSRGLLMDVYLGSTADNVADHPVLPALEVSIPQWRYLNVDLPPTSLQSLSGNSFLTLQMLRLRSHESDLNIDVFQPMRVPSLQNLKVVTGESWLTFQHVLLPWSHLTSVADFPAFDVEALDCLRTMAELRELHVLAGSETRTPIRDVVSLSKLRRLAITESKDAAGSSTEFFSALAIPALLELTLHYHATSVLHFPASPLPLENLIKLDITCKMNSHEENTQHLLDFLTLTPHVESLRLHDISMTVEFCEGLNLSNFTAGIPRRLPCLNFLDLSKCRCPTALSMPLLKMLCSRLQNGRARETEDVEETDLSDDDGTGGSGQISSANDVGAVDQRVFLQRVQIPRRLYIRLRRDWPYIFQLFTSIVDMECGVIR